MVIRSSIPGLEFSTTDGYDWVYGDWRTGNYNGPYPNGPDPTVPQYYSDGNFFAWLGENQGRGVITLHLGLRDVRLRRVLRGTDPSPRSLRRPTTPCWIPRRAGEPGHRQHELPPVDAPGMAYVIVHDTGNQWLIDNLDTDAIVECTEDSDCDDGLFCTGAEACQEYHCVHGAAPSCPDDGLFCNGAEICSATLRACLHTGDPLRAGRDLRRGDAILRRRGEGPPLLRGRMLLRLTD